MTPKASGKSDNFAITTDDQWKLELPSLLDGTGSEMNSMYSTKCICIWYWHKYELCQWVQKSYWVRPRVLNILVPIFHAIYDVTTMINTYLSLRFICYNYCTCGPVYKTKFWSVAGLAIQRLKLWSPKWLESNVAHGQAGVCVKRSNRIEPIPMIFTPNLRKITPLKCISHNFFLAEIVSLCSKKEGFKVIWWWKRLEPTFFSFKIRANFTSKLSPWSRGQMVTWYASVTSAGLMNSTRYALRYVPI